MYNKFKDYSNAKWILMKRYPESINICPYCDNISFSKFYEMEANKCRCKDGSTNRVWLDIEFIPHFKCYRCDSTLSGQMLSSYSEKETIFIDKYFSQKDEKIKYEDFLAKVAEFCIKMRRKMWVVVDVISDGR